MDDTDQTKESGFLSPRRIEAIHIAFNKVFDTARKEGLIRDEKEYRSFNEVFEIAMKIKEGVSVEEITVTKDLGNNAEVPRGGEVVMQEVEEHAGFAAGDDGDGDVSVDMGFSDEDINVGFGEEMQVEEVNAHPQQKRNSSKRRIEQIDVPPSPKKPRRIRHSEPIYNAHPLDNLDIIDSRPSPRRKTLTPQRIQHQHHSSDSELEPTPLDPLPSFFSTPSKSTLDILGIPPLTTITLVSQRETPAKPRDMYIPLYGRRKGRSKRISLDRLWEVHYRLERMKKAGIPLPSYKAPVYKIPAVTKRNIPFKVEVSQPRPRFTSTASSERQERDREDKPAAKIRRGTWGGDRRSAAFKGRYKRLNSRRRSGSDPIEGGSHVGESSSPAAYDDASVGGVARKTRGTGRMKPTGRGGGSVGGGSSSRQVSVTRDGSVGRALSPALAIVSPDTELVYPTANVRTSPVLSESPSISRDLPNPSASTMNTPNTTHDEIVQKPQNRNWGGRRIKGVSMKKTTPTTNTHEVTTSDGTEDVNNTPKQRSGWGGRRIKGVSMKESGLTGNDIGVTMGQQQRSPEL